MKKFTLAIVTSSVLLSACSSMPDWMGGGEADAPLEGKRVSVLAHRTQLVVDPESDAIAAKLPSATPNSSWAVQRSQPVAHPALGSALVRLESQSVGSTPEAGLKLTSTPVVADGTIFTLDGEGKVQARDAANPATLRWEYTLPQEETKGALIGFGLMNIGTTKAKDFLGGNLAVADGMVFVTTAMGQVMAVDAKTGKEIWQRDMKIPVRSAPMEYEGALYFITSNNRLYALNSATGAVLWNHATIQQATRMLGAPTPAVGKLANGRTVILAPYASGELFAVDAKSGEQVWVVSLAGNFSRSAQLGINDISATPLVRGNRVYAISHDGVLLALDLANGSTVWQQEISSLQTPWLAGDLLFVLSSNQELIALHAPTGRIKWVKELPTHADAALSWGGENKGDRIIWSGPVLAGGALYLSGSHGKLVAFSPDNGEQKATYDAESDVMLPPVVAGAQLYLLNNKAALEVWR